MQISKSMAAFLAIVLFQAGYLFCLFFSPSGTQGLVDKTHDEEQHKPTVSPAAQHHDSAPQDARDTSALPTHEKDNHGQTKPPSTTHVPAPKARNPIPDHAELKTYSLLKLRHIYRSFFGVTDTHCPSSRMGSEGDGGWNICNDPAWVPRKPCIVYSFGVGFDFSFDDEVAVVYGCQVFSFDPSMKTESYQRSKLVKFFNIGIGGEGTRGGGTWNISSYTVTGGNETWNISSFSEIREMLNHTAAAIDVVKMDIEWGEWDALPSMIQEGQLVNVRQFAVEFHVEKEEQEDKRKLLTYLGILRDLQEIGFRRYMTHMNPFGISRALPHSEIESCCYEVHFLNANFKRAR